ncbi:unnamed protein product [Closterium sp. NIES-54]
MLWAHACGDLPSPERPTDRPPQPTPADRERFAQGRSALLVWQSCDTAARLALTNLLLECEEAHYNQVHSAQECLVAIKARYSTPTSASLGRLFMPFLFPNLAAFDSTAALVTHMCSLDASYRAACTEAELAVAPPPKHITIHFIVTSLPGHLASVRDALLRKHPSALTIKFLEEVLKDIQSNIRSVAASSGAAAGGKVASGSDSGGGGGGDGGWGGGGSTSESGGGGTVGGPGPAGPAGGGVRPVVWYAAQHRQQIQQLQQGQ